VNAVRYFLRFVTGSIRLVLTGNASYWSWIAVLVALIISGALAFARQVESGLVVTAMRDQVSWGFYIGNFTFLVGVAAAAVVLVIPAYIYDWKPIRQIVVYGELLAVSAIVMCLLFVLVDIGRPDRFWHLLPPWGRLNFPSSILAWDVMVLNLYFLLNFAVVTHILYRAFTGRAYAKRLVVPLVLLSIPMAVGIHTVTAFLYNGLAARPYWNASILAPQFLASAFCSGPAILLFMLQLLRKFTRFEIEDAAFWKIAELMAYAMFLNLFLHGAEAFKEYYSNTEHLLYTRYWYQGLGGHKTLVPYAWSAVSLNVIAFVLFIVPATRRNWVTLNLGCLATYAGVYIEKGMGLIIPGLTPDALGEIYEYYPTLTELRVAAGIFALGFLVFTLMLRVAVPVALGEFRYDRSGDGGDLEKLGAARMTGIVAPTPSASGRIASTR
jgi:Ni/Fe-hydrogenase subunit HybB-like protein